eukprot:15346034-Ditylum_brightwellii.AAC.1
MRLSNRLKNHFIYLASNEYGNHIVSLFSLALDSSKDEIERTKSRWQKIMPRYKAGLSNGDRTSCDAFKN